MGRFVNFKSTCVFAVLAAILFLLPINYSRAQVGAVIGVIGGSHIVNEAGKDFRETIEHARAAANALLGRADDIAKARLNQVDKILSETVGGLIGQTEEAALAILEKATKEAKDLETRIFDDLRAVIWETECAAKRVVIEDLETALGGLGKLVGTGQIELTPPLRVFEKPKRFRNCLWNCKDPYVVDVMEPFAETYVQVRDLMELSISDDYVSDDTPADNIVGTYEYLSSFALKASCFYIDTETRLNREHVKYRKLADDWNKLVVAKF